MTRPRPLAKAALAAAVTAGAAGIAAVAAAQAVNDYPTHARAEYVFVCMAANGQGPAVLARCACAIDTVAGIIPYDRYVAAQTVLAMRQAGGERAALFRDTAPAMSAVADLRRAEAEAEILCF